MKNKRRFPKILTSLVITIIIVFSQFSFAFAEKIPTLEAHYINAVVEMIKKEYRFDADETTIYKDITEALLTSHPELLEEAIAASTKSLDSHSEYYTREDLKAFNQYIDREYVGIGVTVERLTGGVHISAVSTGGPAYNAGIKTGDIIYKVEGEDALGFSIADASDKIRGEAGTVVNITVKRGEQLIDFAITRAAVTVESSSYTILGDEVGYIKIDQFNSNTPLEVKEALEYFNVKQIKKTIVDVRDNPGGELGGVLGTLYHFVPRGKLLLTIDYKTEGYDLRLKSQAEFTKTNRKMVVLVNENSASAAEVFAGGIMYNNIGVTVGQKTYGKGSVQEFVGLYSPPGHELGDIKITVAEYSLPNGESIHRKGLEPNYKIKNTYESLSQEGLSKFFYAEKYSIGDIGKEVLALEQRLDLLGYYVGKVDEVYDEETAVAVRLFQTETGLTPTGVADHVMQSKLIYLIDTIEVLKDNQLDKAFEILTGKSLFSVSLKGE